MNTRAATGAPIRSGVDVTCGGLDATGFRDRVRRPEHHLRGDAGPVGALATNELVGDPDDVEARTGETKHEVLTCGPTPSTTTSASSAATTTPLADLRFSWP